MSEPKKWELSRRSFLHGAGVAMALPALEAMLPSVLREARATGVASANPRMLLCHFPNGQAMGDWAQRAWDATNGGYGGRSGAKVVPQHTRDIMAANWAEINVLSNLTANAAGIHDKEQKNAYCPTNANGCGDAHGGKHVPIWSCAAAQFQGSGNWYIDETFDYAVRNDAFGGRSTELLGIAGSLDGGVDSYHSPRHSNCISWSKGQPLDMMLNPRAFFNKIAGVTTSTGGGGTPTTSDSDRVEGSVIDAVKEHFDHLKTKGLGKSDMQTLDNYLASMRQAETDMSGLTTGGGTIAVPASCNSMTAPADFSTISAAQFVTRFNIFKQLIVNAFQCNKTHLITFMFGTEGTNVGFVPGVPGGTWHRHFDGNNFYYANLVQMWTIQQFNDIVNGLKGVRDVDGNTLLHNSVALLCSDVGPSNGHTGDLQFIQAGQLGGKIKTGLGELRGAWGSATANTTSYIGYNDKPTMTQAYDVGDVFYTILKSFGSTRSQFGQINTKVIKEIYTG